jgi:hypothetical protein
MFLQKKQESSGFPSTCQTIEQQNKYIKNYLDNEGIQLNKDEIKKNSGKRFVFKLLLNSMWGRLAMNTNRTSFKIINKASEWFDLLSDDQYDISSIDISHPNALQVCYNNLYNEGSVETSVTHAAFVTCHARLKLYSELEKLGDRVLYFDTDSIIYINRVGEYKPILGDYLGQLTSELEQDDYIEEFVSAGPKNYSYRTNGGKYSCTVKGISQNVTTSEKLNFNSIKDIVCSARNKVIEVNQLKFFRSKFDWTVTCEEHKKLYRFVYDKRILLDDLTTLPYGY